MSAVDDVLVNLNYLDTLACQDTLMHNLDPRAKVLISVFFIATVVSFDPYNLAKLLPLFLIPVACATLGNIPFSYIFKRLLFGLPFVFFVAIFNPIFDTSIALKIGKISISKGWISFLSIHIRFFLTIGMAIILIATTGFSKVCMALQSLKIPEVFITQLLFLYRYIFVLIEEAMRLLRARNQRSFGNKGKGLRVWSFLVGNLLLRTLARAERIHQAMLARGFSGKINSTELLHWRLQDTIFFVLCISFCILMRMYNLPELLGKIITQ